MAKELVKEYFNLCGGNNSMASSMLMDDEQLYHSHNAVFDNIGVVEKAQGFSPFWDLSSYISPIKRIQQISTDFYAVVDGNLIKKGSPDSTIDTNLKLNTNLESVLDHIFYLSDAGVIRSTNGTIVDNKHLINAPTDIDFIRFANGRMYAFKGDRFYFSSYPRTVVTTVVGDQDGLQTIEVNDIDGTKYLAPNNTVDVYSADGLTKRNTAAITISEIISATTFKASEAITTIKNGDIIVYNGMKDTETLMWATDENTGDWYYVEGGDGSPVNAREHLGTLLIVKPQSIWRYTETALSKIADVGTTAPNSFQTIGKYALFANNNGLYIVDGNDVQRISHPVQKYFDNADLANIGDWTAGCDGKRYRLWIGDTSHEDLSDCEIVLDTEGSKYEIGTEINASCYENFVVDGVLKTYMGTDDGYVVKLGDGLSRSYNDSAIYDIEFLIKTKADSLGAPGEIKQFRRVVFYTKPGTILSLKYSVDGRNFERIGEINDDAISFDLSGVRGRTIQFLLSEKSRDRLPGVYGYELSAIVDEEI